MFLAVTAGKHNIHLLGLFCTKIKDIANLGALHSLEFTLLDTKFFYSFVQYFLIHGNVFTTMKVQNILTSITYRLKLMAELRKGPTACKCDIGVLAKTQAIVDPHIRLLYFLVVGIKVFGRLVE